MDFENMLSFNKLSPIASLCDYAPSYSKMQLEQLHDAAHSFIRRIDDTDAFFKSMLELSVYICLLNVKQRDTVFFENIRQHECRCDFMPAAHDAKRFIMEECRRYIPFFKCSAPDEIDAVLGTLICAFNNKIYSLENMCASHGFFDPIGFPDWMLLRRVRETAQSLFPYWDSVGELLYTSRPFSLIVCLYLKYRSDYGRDTAVRMIYGIDKILNMKENEDFFDLIYKAIALVDGIYNSSDAKLYRPAVVLWHIFRVLRRMSEGIACDEWMTCGCELMCDSCESRLAPEEPENIDDDETEEADDEDDSVNDIWNLFNSTNQNDKETEEPDDEETEEVEGDSDENDLDFVDLNNFEDIDSSEWEKYLSNDKEV